jgi:predicted DNA-binding transcriptional regulator AlpA
MPDGGTRPPWTPRALREDEAAYYVGLSATTFRREVVPAVAPVRVSPGRIAWLREDLDRWLDSRRAPPEPAIHGTPAEPARHHGRDPFEAALARLSPRRRPRRQAPPA